MNYQTHLLLGWLFIIAAGVIYTLERLRSAIEFVGVNVSDEMYSRSQDSTSLGDNLVFVVFLLISFWFFYKAKKMK
ncbi:hypothetical protein BSG1_04675 [Bacillus sp. SG-1]|nr:hypothetical protein BSG1_04675 [Bacillus sp. SG-1]